MVPVVRCTVSVAHRLVHCVQCSVDCFSVVGCGLTIVVVGVILKHLMYMMVVVVMAMAGYRTAWVHYMLVAIVC